MRGNCPCCGRDEFLDRDMTATGFGSVRHFRCRCGGVATMKVVDPDADAYKWQTEGW